MKSEPAPTVESQPVEKAEEPEKPVNTKETNQKFSSKPLSMMEQVLVHFN